MLILAYVKMVMAGGLAAWEKFSSSAVVKFWSKEGTLVNQSHEWPQLIDIYGDDEGWPVWSDPTDELL